MFHHNLETIYSEVRKLFFSGLLRLLLHLHFNPIILLHPNVNGTFIYTWTKYKLELKSEKIKEKKTFFYATILENFQTKILISETTSIHYFSPRIPNL